MPIYEYECDRCGKITEAMQKFSDPPLTDCECCDGGHLTKLISKSAFHLKGSGWYVTDYSGKTQSNPQDSQKTDQKSESASKTESKTETAGSKE